MASPVPIAWIVHRWRGYYGGRGYLEDADAAQEAAIAHWQLGIDCPTTLLRRVMDATRVADKDWRHGGMERSAGPERAHHDTPEALAACRQTVERLPSPLRTVAEGLAAGMTQADIALRAGCDPSTICLRVRALRASLAISLG